MQLVWLAVEAQGGCDAGRACEVGDLGKEGSNEEAGLRLRQPHRLPMASPPSFTRGCLGASVHSGSGCTFKDWLGPLDKQKRPEPWAGWLDGWVGWVDIGGLHHLGLGLRLGLGLGKGPWASLIGLSDLFVGFFQLWALSGSC